MNTTITGLLAITVTGLIATTPRSLTTSDTETVTSFRFAALNPNADQPLGGQPEDPRWYTVTATGVLARNAAASLRKGDRVIVAGIVTTRYRDNDGTGVGATDEIAAASIGHDLSWGTTVYTRHTTAVLAESAAQD